MNILNVKLESGISANGFKHPSQETAKHPNRHRGLMDTTVPTAVILPTAESRMRLMSCRSLLMKTRSV